MPYLSRKCVDCFVGVAVLMWMYTEMWAIWISHGEAQSRCRTGTENMKKCLLEWLCPLRVWKIFLMVYGWMYDSIVTKASFGLHPFLLPKWNSEGSDKSEHIQVLHSLLKSCLDIFCLTEMELFSLARVFLMLCFVLVVRRVLVTHQCCSCCSHRSQDCLSNISLHW